MHRPLPATLVRTLSSLPHHQPLSLFVVSSMFDSSLPSCYHFPFPRSSRYHATFYYSSSSRNVPSLFTRSRPRFYLPSERSFHANLYIFINALGQTERGRRFVSFLESIEAYGRFNRVDPLSFSLADIRLFHSIRFRFFHRPPVFTFSKISSSGNSNPSKIAPFVLPFLACALSFCFFRNFYRSYL